MFKAIFCFLLSFLVTYKRYLVSKMGVKKSEIVLKIIMALQLTLNTKNKNE